MCGEKAYPYNHSKTRVEGSIVIVLFDVDSLFLGWLFSYIVWSGVAELLRETQNKKKNMYIEVIRK